MDSVTISHIVHSSRGASFNITHFVLYTYCLYIAEFLPAMPVVTNTNYS